MAAEPRKRVSERPNEKKEEDSHGKPGKKRVKFDDAVTELCETARLLSDGTKSVRDVILQQNAADKQLLMKTVAEHRTTKEFRTACSERLHGQWQWGMCSHNIRHPGYLCKHACAYCYIGPMFKVLARLQNSQN